MNEIRKGEIALAILRKLIISFGGVSIDADEVKVNDRDLDDAIRCPEIDYAESQALLRVFSREQLDALDAQGKQDQEVARVLAESASGEADEDQDDAKAGEESGEATAVSEGASTDSAEVVAETVEGVASADVVVGGEDDESTVVVEAKVGDTLPPEVNGDVEVDAVQAEVSSEPVEDGDAVVTESVEGSASTDEVVATAEVAVEEASTAEAPVAEDESAPEGAQAENSAPEVSSVVSTASEETAEGESPVAEAVQAS